MFLVVAAATTAALLLRLFLSPLCAMATGRRPDHRDRFESHWRVDGRGSIHRRVLALQRRPGGAEAHGGHAETKVSRDWYVRAMRRASVAPGGVRRLLLFFVVGLAFFLNQSRLPSATSTFAPHESTHYSGACCTADKRRQDVPLLSLPSSLLRGADLLLQGCQLTQYTEGYTRILLDFARKVLVSVRKTSRPQYADKP